MNTLEILYQAFKVRYSLNQLQQVLDRGCRLALIGSEEARASALTFLGQPIPGLNKERIEDDLIPLSFDLSEADLKELRTCDACIVLFDEGVPEVEFLQELARDVPLHVKALWICLDAEGEKRQSLYEEDLTLPTVWVLSGSRPAEKFLKQFLSGLPQVALVMARDYSHLRTEFCKTMTRRTALRNGIRSGLASLPLRAIPVIGPALSFLAISAETLMLTASQLRLSFVIAAVHGRPLDFFDRIGELWPIVGSAFGFRALSRSLVRMLPKVGAGVKASVAFSGTYAVGEASRLYYELGRPTSDEVRRELMRRAQEEGAREAQLLFRRVMAGQSIESNTDTDSDSDTDSEDAVLKAVDSLTCEPQTELVPGEEPEFVEQTVEMQVPSSVSPGPETENSSEEPSSEARENVKAALLGMQKAVPKLEVKGQESASAQKIEQQKANPVAAKPKSSEPSAAKPKKSEPSAGDDSPTQDAKASKGAAKRKSKKGASRRSSRGKGRSQDKS